MKARVFASSVALALCAGPAVAEVNFNDLSLVGSAAVVPGALRLTPAQGGQAGAAWLKEKVPVASGFETYFDFVNWGGFLDGAGLAFVIQNSSPTALGSPGQGNGYVGIANGLAVEFDTWYNGSAGNLPYPNGDLSSSHVAVMTRGAEPLSDRHVYSLGGATPPTNMSNAQVQRAYISYTPGRLKVFVNRVTGTPNVEVAVDLASLLPLDGGSAYVGLTAATGFGYRNQDIRRWEFGASVDPLPGVAAGPFTRNGSTYYLLENSTWEDAEAKARTLGGHLVTINDADENQWVNATFAQYGGVSRQLWIGMNDAVAEGVFGWSSGEPVTYTNWDVKQPDNFQGVQDYGFIWVGRSGRWDDIGAVRAANDLNYHGIVEGCLNRRVLRWWRAWR